MPSSKTTDCEFSYGCIYCRVGEEERVATELMNSFQDVQAIAPKRLYLRRYDGQLHEETAILFPGYVFIYAPSTFPIYDVSKNRYVYKILLVKNRDWHLIGNDLALVKELFRIGGIVGFSKAYFDGDRIRITEGLLKEYEGSILRVNRRKQTAQIRISIGDNALTVWLGFECIQRNEKS